MKTIEEKRQELINKINIMQNPRSELHEIFKARLKQILEMALQDFTIKLSEFEVSSMQQSFDLFVKEFCDDFVENNVVADIRFNKENDGIK